MTKKYQICHHQIRFFQAQNAPKSVFGRGYALDPAGGAYDAPPERSPRPPSRLGRGMPPPHFLPRSLPMAAYPIDFSRSVPL